MTPKSIAPIRLGKQFTILAKVRLTGKPADVCSLQSPDGGRVLAVAVEEGPSGSLLVAQCWTDFSTDPLRLEFPVARIGTTGNLTIIVRYTGVNLQMYVDGVLVDEEWPAGNIESAPLTAQAGPSGGDVALWDVSLPDDDIARMSGGADRVAIRAREILGDEAPVTSYWRPRGYRTGVGDCMPFFHGGRFHLFYLFDRHKHQSKWRRGAHQWAHCSTTDLTRWAHHPLAVPITGEWEGSICTGSVFHWHNLFHAYYAVRTMDGSPAPLFDALSEDGVTFAKRIHLTALAAPYRAASGRDPVVFRDPESGLFHMLVTTSITRSNEDQSHGCLAHLTSTDLSHWDQHEPFIESDWGQEEPECPDHFQWGDWWYLLFSIGAHTHYRISRNPLGPWLRPKVDTIDGPRLCVVKTAAYTNARRIAAGFVGDDGYGGQVVFRELIQHADGSLGSRFVEELIPDAGVKRTTIHVEPDGASQFSITLNDVDIRFDGVSETVTIGDATLRNVAGLDVPFPIDVIRYGDLLDICIDNRRTMVVRLAR